ncbi:hypothetical protein PEDI_15320 [Persicobacter diffluens]|uniref:Uncharacterized protein n=1 Tax=Persicobacter diffluens TaxID=981 RepID=A0AAN4VZ20_9BACT|nr:hypothetical protein PEDI_15320 [Persicobacter diffluens]
MVKSTPSGCKFELLEAILDNFLTIAMLSSQYNRVSLLQYFKFSLRILAFKHALTFFNTSGQEQNPAARINSHLIENELEISIPASYGDSVSIKLFDQFGRALIEKSLMAEKSNRLQSREELEIAGHYFLSINQNGNLQNFHLVKVNEKQDFDFIVQLEVPEIIPALVIAPNPIQNQ